MQRLSISVDSMSNVRMLQSCIAAAFMEVIFRPQAQAANKELFVYVNELAYTDTVFQFTTRMQGDILSFGIILEHKAS